MIQMKTRDGMINLLMLAALWPCAHAALGPFSIDAMDQRLVRLLHRHNLHDAVPLLEGQGVYDLDRLSLLSHGDVDDMIQVQTLLIDPWLL